MAREEQLTIKPRFDRQFVRSEVDKLISEFGRVQQLTNAKNRALNTARYKLSVNGMAKFKRDHSRAFRSAINDAKNLERAYDASSRRITHGIGKINTGLRGVLGTITSVKGLMFGMGAGVAGKGLFDVFVGSNSRLEQSMITFETMLGSRSRAQKLIKQLDSYSARTPFQAEEIMETSRRLTRTTGTDLGRNLDLVDLSAQMASMSPSKTIVDAAEALLDAEMGEFERLKEFGVKIRIRDIERKIQKTTGSKRKATGEEILSEVQQRFSGMVGGRNLVEMQSQSASGQISTLIDKFKLRMRDLGKPAFESFKRGLVQSSALLDSVMTDSTFQQDLKDLAGGVERAITLTTELITKAPMAYREIRSFLDTHGQTLLAVGGIYGVNKVSGGALGRGTGALARRAFFGNGAAGGGALAGVAGMAGVQKVWVMNPGLGGLPGKGGKGGFLGRNSMALTGAELASVGYGGSGGLAGAAGAAGVGAGAVALVTVGGSLYAFHKALSTTTATVKAFEAREKKIMEERSKQAIQGPAQLGARETMLYREARLTGGLERRLREEDFAGAKGSIFQMLGGGKNTFTGSQDQQEALQLINTILQRRGAGSFMIKPGQKISKGQFIGGKAGLAPDEQLFVNQMPELSRILKANPALENDPRVRQAEQRAEDLLRVLRDNKVRANALNAATPTKVEINVYGQGEEAGLKAANAAKGQLEVLLRDMERDQALIE